jgi:anti-sigma factor RsiW
LHALEAADESPVAAHMPDCPTCTSTAAETEEVGATLGLSVPQEIPSAELEQRVLRVTGDKWVAPATPPTSPTRRVRRITLPSWLRTRGTGRGWWPWAR